MNVSRDGRWLGWTDGTAAWVWDLDNDEKPPSLLGGGGRPGLGSCPYVLHPEGWWVAAEASGALSRYELPDGKELPGIRGGWVTESGAGSRLAIAPDGAWLAAAGRHGSVWLLDSAGKHLQTLLTGQPGAVEVLAASSNGCALAGASEDGNVALWDIGTGSLRWCSPRLALTVRALAMSRDGSWIASGGDEKVLRVWDANSGMQRERLEAENAYHNPGIAVLAADSDGSWITATGWLTSALIGEVEPVGMPIEQEVKTVGSGYPVAVLPTVPFLAVQTNGKVSLFDLNRRERVDGFPWGPEAAMPQINALASDPSGCWLAVGGLFKNTHEGSLWLWRLGTKERRCLIQGGESMKEFAIVRGKFRFALWLWKSFWGTHQRAGEVLALAFSPSGRWLASAGISGCILLWDPNRSANRDPLLRVLKKPRHRGKVCALASGADGTWLASAGEDGTIRLWDIVEGQHLRTIQASSRPIRALAVHPQGRWLFSAGDDGLIRRWVLGNPVSEPPRCDRAMQPLPEGDWVVWEDPDDDDRRRWIDPTDRAKRWLGWHAPTADGAGWAHQPLDGT